LQYIVVHRVGWNDEAEWTSRGYSMDAAGVRDFYAQEVHLHFPYTFAVLRGGRIQQGRRLLDVTPHAAAFNKEAIGIGVLGDFRFLPAEYNQWNSAVDLCAALIGAWPHLQIVGHTELGEEATSVPGKQCPGKLFDMAAFRDEVQLLHYENGVRSLLKQGVVL
jgi:hypothetical protein